MRINLAVSLKFPEQRLSTQGKPGPKPRPKGVGDGERVHIPAPLLNRLSEGVTQEGKPSHDWMCAFKPVGKIYPGKSG